MSSPPSFARTLDELIAKADIDVNRLRLDAEHTEGVDVGGT
jgi:hypothetical protein